VPITSIDTNPDKLTLTAIGDYSVPVDRLWAAWTDPRQLERFWGPPEWPATFTRHEVREGGRSSYVMTGPDGETSGGYWVFEIVEPKQRFVIQEGFAAEDGTPNDEMPACRMEVSFESTDAGSRFVVVTTFPSVEAMEQLTSMGMVEGMKAAFGQLDAVLAGAA
jgi:uncharacterized protein YndB with AHSA1/START domain